MSNAMTTRRLRSFPLLAGPLVCLLAASCSWFTQDVVVHESPAGSVRLERISDRGVASRYRPPLKGLDADHPAALRPELLARVLRGVGVRAGSGPPGSQRAFSDEAAAFLSPLLSEALAAAQPNQRVRFQVAPARPGDGATEGWLYVKESLLHLVLERDRRGDLEKRDLRFAPEAARRRSAEGQAAGLLGLSEVADLVVDYGLLARLPEAAPPATDGAGAELAGRTTAAPPERPRPTDAAREEEIRALKDHALKKDMENEALKAELSELRKQLADHEAELNKLKKGKGKKDRQRTQP